MKQVTNIEFERGDEERGTITYGSMVTFKYNNIYYDMEVDVTYSWEQDKEPKYSFFYDCVPDELIDVWDEIVTRLEEEIIRWNKQQG